MTKETSPVLRNFLLGLNVLADITITGLTLAAHEPLLLPLALGGLIGGVSLFLEWCERDMEAGTTPST